MVAAAEGRPRRRFYRVTAAGERTLEDLHAKEAESARRRPAAAVAT
jgi:DNA-binding PadR family transcriptional regulator